MKNRRIRLIAVFLTLTCFLTGCGAIGLNVETQLIPPNSSGEQEAIRAALDEYVRSHTENGESAYYTLKYPSSGRYLSAFITLDQVKENTPLSPNSAAKSPDDADEKVTPDTAIAFYRRNSVDAQVHINLLKRSADGTWTSVADVEGKGEAVHRVEFGDLDNNGMPELLIGWHLYNSRDSRLSVYDLDDNLTAHSLSTPYTDLVVGDITADGADDILLLNIMTGTGLASARLLSYGEGGVLHDSHTMLDSSIISFGDHILAELADGANGVFVDCYKEQRAMITELICWKDGKLTAPLCDQVLQMNSVTARELPIACRDIDGDGAVEWPVTTRMPGFEDAEMSKTLWHTEWCGWDHTTQRITTEFVGLLPAEDGYMLRLREGWEELPAAYNVSTRTLTLHADMESGEWLFRLGTFPLDKKKSLPAGYTLLDETEDYCYAVCVSENYPDITIEEIKYLFYRM